jgi:tripartite ATP-independent transporter DctM subunit
MSPELVGVLGIILLLVLIASGMWIAMATAIVGFIGLVYIRGFEQAFTMTGQAPYTFIGRYEMGVMPMFILMSCVVAQTGIGADCYYTMNKLFGQLRGGLAIATTWACALFGAITGSTVNGIIVMSKIALPEMQKHNYDTGLSSGVVAAASTMGILIPPSSSLIVYGILTETSIGRLFMAGIIPGIIEAILYMATIYLICRFRPRMGPPGPKTGLREKLASLKNTWAVIALFILVMGGIYFGFFTTTEAGAIGAAGAIIIATASRRLNLRGFVESILETVVMTTMILLMLMGVAIFQKFIAFSELPFMMGNFITGLELPSVAIIIIISIIYVVLGCFLPAMTTLILTIPIIFPVVMALGIDPIWYGVLMVITIELGGITPPMGLDVFVLSGVSGIPIGTIFRGVIPFVIADVIRLILLIAIPATALFLPNTMM